MERLINLIKIFYQLITFRYTVVKKMRDEINDNDIYKDIVEEELEFYNFYKLTGIYMRNTNERKKYLEFYKKNKKILDMQFKEFVSTHNYIDIDLEQNTIKVKLNKTYIHYIGYVNFILIIILYISFILIYQMLFFSLTYFFIGSIFAIILMLISISFIDPYDKAKKIQKSL